MFDDDDEPEEIEAAVDAAPSADASAASTGSREQD